MRKTIAEHMADVMRENAVTTISPAAEDGQLYLFNECAGRCVHSNLSELLYHERVNRIIEAVAKSSLFELVGYKHAEAINGRRLMREFRLVPVLKED